VGDIADWLTFVILQGNADMLASVNIGTRRSNPRHSRSRSARRAEPAFHPWFQHQSRQRAAWRYAMTESPKPGHLCYIRSSRCPPQTHTVPPTPAHSTAALIRSLVALLESPELVKSLLVLSKVDCSPRPIHNTGSKDASSANAAYVFETASACTAG
jgi:hypothetical protein